MRRVISKITDKGHVVLEESTDVHRERFLDMLISRQFPGMMTDVTFLQGHCNGNQFAGRSEFGDMCRRNAEAAGISTVGKVYFDGAARYPGDPEAWLADRHDLQKLMERRNWDCEGVVNHKAVQMIDDDPAPPPRLADDIVDEIYVEKVEENPDLLRRDVEEVRAEIVEDHGRPV